MRRSKPIKRGAPLRRRKPLPKRAKKRKLRAGKVQPNEKYLTWIRQQPCVGLEDWPPNSIENYGVQGHYCQGPVQPNHDRHFTGMGIKDPDETCVPMCWILHTQWTDHTGRYEGWDRDKRHGYMAAWRMALNYRYTSETGIKLLEG